MSRNAEILKLAARISNPWGDDPFPKVDDETMEEAVAVLKQNNVSLLHLKAKYNETEMPSQLIKRIREEDSVFHRLRTEFEKIQVVFEEEGIDSIFIKSTGLYPSFPFLSSNLDVLVPLEFGDSARKVLRNLGYIELLNVEEPSKFLFRRFVLDGPSFTFHLHEQVGWGVPFIDTSAVWENKRRSPDDPRICIPGPVEALLITLAHWFYEDKVLSLNNLYLSANAFRALPVSLEEALTKTSSRGWEDGFIGAAEVFRESWKRIFGFDFFDKENEAYLKKRLLHEGFMRSVILRKVRYIENYPAIIPFAANKLVYYRKVLRDKKRSFPVKLKDVITTLFWAVHLKAPIHSQKPMLIGISGCDGSGKTVHVENLESAFRTCGLRTKVIWTRGSSSRFMSFFIRLGKRIFPRGSSMEAGSTNSRDMKSNAPTQKEKILAQRESINNPLLRFLFSIFYSIDLAAVYCFKTRYNLLIGNVVISDRYITDAMVDFAVSSGKQIEHIPLALRILKNTVPKPDLSFILDVDEKEALRRKPEEGDVAHLAEARRMFLEIGKEKGNTVIPPDATLEAINEMIVPVSLSTYYKKYRTFINALFFKNPNQLNPDRWR